jgi:hypothetical protein
MNQLPFPSAEELRMLRAIALIAVAEAACIGEYRASFRGFRVHAWRINPQSFGIFVPVRVETRCGTGVLERSDVNVACTAKTMRRGDPIHGPRNQTRERWSVGLNGCGLSMRTAFCSGT